MMYGDDIALIDENRLMLERHSGASILLILTGVRDVAEQLQERRLNCYERVMRRRSYIRCLGTISNATIYNARMRESFKSFKYIALFLEALRVKCRVLPCFQRKKK